VAKTYTEKQQLFIEHLFGAAKGNAIEAKVMAGYSPDFSTSQLVKSVEEEIVERTKRFLVENGPKAVLGLVGIIDNPTQLGANYKLIAVKDLLDRIGVAKTEKIDVGGGVFLLPPKNEA
jgi:hypothetical protein